MMSRLAWLLLLLTGSTALKIQQQQQNPASGSTSFNPAIVYTEEPHCCTEEEVGPIGDANMKAEGLQEIPNIVFTMGPFKPEEIEAANKEMFPAGTEFRFYNHNDLWPEVKKISANLEKETNITGAAEAFKNFRPHSYQSDLWRPMMLWEYGGYYLDAKIQLTKPVETWVQKDDVFAVCRDVQLPRDRNPVQPDYWSAMLAAPPRSPMLLPIIRKLVDHALHRTYPTVGLNNRHGKLYVAGPGAFSDALHFLDMKPAVRCLNQGNNIISPDGTPIAFINDDIHHDMRVCKDCDEYGHLYKSGQAYCNDPVVPDEFHPAGPCKSFD